MLYKLSVDEELDVCVNRNDMKIFLTGESHEPHSQYCACQETLG